MAQTEGHVGRGAGMADTAVRTQKPSSVNSIVTTAPLLYCAIRHSLCPDRSPSVVEGQSYRQA